MEIMNTKAGSPAGIKSKIVVLGTVTNTTPLLIASGIGETFDFEVIKDETGKPFMPGSGFAGMLTKAMYKYIKDPDFISSLEYFWGSDNQNEDSGSQSHVIISNLYLKEGSEFEITSRDSVSIDTKTNLAKNNFKLDYELIEPNAKFDFKAEITVRNQFDLSHFVKLTSFMKELLESGDLQQGAFKSSSFGYIKLENVLIYQFDFPDPETKWFGFLAGNTQPANKANEYISGFDIKKDRLTIKGEFEIVSSLIIRKQSDETKQEIDHQTDFEHLSRDGRALLTGKSLRGVFRHRSLKILNTLNQSQSEAITNNLFGFVNEQEKMQKQSRFKPKEVEISGCDMNQVQPRVKIDRYTGGTIEGALMQSKPVWHKEETIQLHLEIEECNINDAALILLVMKDLINEDLPIGGEKSIGRGLLRGRNMVVEGKVHQSEKDKKPWEVFFEFDNNGLIIPDPEVIKMLNDWVNQLKN